MNAHRFFKFFSFFFSVVFNAAVFVTLLCLFSMLLIPLGLSFVSVYLSIGTMFCFEIPSTLCRKAVVLARSIVVFCTNKFTKTRVSHYEFVAPSFNFAF